MKQAINDLIAKRLAAQHRNGMLEVAIETEALQDEINALLDKPPRLKCWASIDEDGNKLMWVGSKPEKEGENWSNFGGDSQLIAFTDMEMDKLFPQSIKAGECKCVIIPMAAVINIKT